MHQEFMNGFWKNTLIVRQEIGGLLSVIRHRQDNLTQKMVASGTGISRRSLVEIENNRFGSIDIILRVYSFYVWMNFVTPKERIEFERLLNRLWNF